MEVKKSAIGIGLVTAIASSLCCITPLLAVVAGASGIAATFQWVEPLQPYLIGLTVIALGFAWYQQLKPIAKDDCACDVTKTSFFQGKSFLGIITVFAALMLAFPLYSKALFPSHDRQAVSLIDESQAKMVEFEVVGMTCSGCEGHVEHAVGKLPGIIEVKASYQFENVTVKFDSSQVGIAAIEDAIRTTNYTVKQHQTIQ